jgi:hypothetical protein
MTLSNFVRDAVLRQSGAHARVRRRMLPDDAAETVRVLNGIGTKLREHCEGARAGKALTTVELDACIADVQGALLRFQA